MPVLLVPPVEVVSESPELPAQLRQARSDYAAQLRSALGVRGEAKSTERIGAFRGLERYDYDGPGDAILYAAFLVAPGRDSSSEFLRVGALVRAGDCTLAGATWSKGAAELPGLPDGLRAGGPPLSGAKARTSREVNTVRWETEARGPWRKVAMYVLDAVAGETLASRRLPVNGTLTRLACAWNTSTSGPASAAPSMALRGALVVTPGPGGAEGYPRRAHRVLRATIAVEEPKETTGAKETKEAKETRRADGTRGTRAGVVASWPRAVASVTLVGGVFGDLKEVLLAPKPPAAPFAPGPLASEVALKVDPSVHDVRPGEFGIARRDRRWVFLDRGRAYGLEVGTHLVGPGGSKLHVIHFAPGEAGIDVAVALVREEDPGSPLKTGDRISFDPTRYPVGGGAGAAGDGASPPLETQPL